jgi:hypothetical protein
MSDIKQTAIGCPCCGAQLIIVGDFERGVDLLNAELLEEEE